LGLLIHPDAYRLDKEHQRPQSSSASRLTAGFSGMYGDSLSERREAGFRFRIVLGQGHEHADAPHPIRLLRARRQRHKNPAAYSFTSIAMLTHIAVTQQQLPGVDALPYDFFG
jgi:hypothetical protein